MLRAVIAWCGFLTSELLNKTDAFLRKAHKFVYTTEIANVADLLHIADNKLFTLCLPFHCLHSLLPQPMPVRSLYKESFIN